MTILGTVLSTFPVGEATKLFLEYEPVIEAIIIFLQNQKDEKQRALAMTSITRGLHYASQTGDTTQLEEAIRNHCSSSGCSLP